MQAIKKMGISYGKLGFSTDLELIERRMIGVEAAAQDLEDEDLPQLVRYALDLKSKNDDLSFFREFTEKDPTFDVRSDEKEAVLLASSVAEYEMESHTQLSGQLALFLVTSSFGSIRASGVDDKLVSFSETVLAEHQRSEIKAPPRRKYFKRPEDHDIEGLMKYVEKNALAAANSDNELLDYIQRLEEEIRVQWWVMNDWSSERRIPFSKLKPVEAAFFGAKELADKASSGLGLFAAPALLSKIIENGRRSGLGKISIAEAVSLIDITWRSDNFSCIAEADYADLLPLCSALGLAALSDDEDDWKPRFKRLTGLDSSLKLKPVEFATQLYRECHALGWFGE